MATTNKRTSTSEMQVTSIRLEPELKAKLRELSGELGYQTLIREVLWQYVRQQDGQEGLHLRRLHLRATIGATAQQAERCLFTGVLIQPGQPMWLGLTTAGEWVPLSQDYFS